MNDTRLRKARATPSKPADPRALLHELEVHQIELELQNEELRSARHETELALARYTELFDFAPVGYATVSPDEKIRELNLAGAELLGEHRSRLIGTQFATLLDVSDRQGFSKMVARAMEGGGREHCELNLARRHGKAVWVHFTATLLPRAEPRVLLALEDVTERRLYEERLQRTELALREADRRKDEFLAILSHELRNPLAPIRNSVFVLARAEPGGEQSRRARLIIDRQVTHLTRLIDDLLDVTRIARGKIDLRRQHLDLGKLARRALDDHKGSFEAMGIALEDELAAQPLCVDADPARMLQVISNLLGNALKFTPRGGRVQMRLCQRGDEAVLAVSDDGIGISPEVIENLFVPFAQAPQSVDRPSGGLGLGLAMVKGLIELHAGRVSISSSGVGRGTEVCVELPLQAAGAEATEQNTPVSVRSRRILIIEDHLDASETLREALAFNGHDVRVAHDGRRGIELAREFNPEVVICDIGLPGMDGYAVARAFSADEQLKHSVLVALSGYAQPEDLQRASEAGFHCHVAKPANLENLERVLAEASRERGRPRPADLERPAHSESASLAEGSGARSSI